MLTGTIARINQYDVIGSLDNIRANTTDESPITIEQMLVWLPVQRGSCWEEIRWTEECIAIWQIRDTDGIEQKVLLCRCCYHVRPIPFNDVSNELSQVPLLFLCDRFPTDIAS